MPALRPPLRIGAALTAAEMLYDAEPGWWVALGRLGTPKDALV